MTFVIDLGGTLPCLKYYYSMYLDYITWSPAWLSEFGINIGYVDLASISILIIVW